MRNIQEIVVGYYPSVEKRHQSKDVCLMPYYIGKYYDLKVEVATFIEEGKTLIKDTNIFDDRFKFLFFKTNMFFLRKFSLFFYILKNSYRIKVLYLYQFKFSIPYKLILVALLYKFLNKRGVLHIRFEADFAHLGNLPSYPRFKSFFIKKYLKAIDVFGTICTEKAIDTFRPIFTFSEINVKLQINGFDSYFIKSIVNSIKPYKEKQNIICTSGRLDLEVKGLDVFLKALNDVDLNNWKVHLYGGDEAMVSRMINSIVKEEKKQKIKVFGTVSYNDLYRGLNSSKVYVLSSYKDGMPLAVVEAMALGNLIISADHHGMTVALKGGRIGRLFSVGDDKQLANILQQTINDSAYLEKTQKKSQMHAWDNYSWESIVKSIYKR